MTVSNAYGRKGRWIVMLQDFQFKIIHQAGSKHLNVNVLSQNPVGSLEEDEDFGSDVMEQEKKLGITLASARSNASNEVSINLFTLQPTRQAKSDVEEHHLVGNCGGLSTNSPLKEGLSRMDEMDYRSMVVEAQIVVDATKNKQKGKSVETEGQSEDDQARQMDIWEDNVSITLLTGGHLEAELDNIANIDRAKKQMMKYHWSKDTLFFYNLVVPRPAERKMLIEKIHEEIRHFGATWTLVEVKKRFFWHDRTKVSRNSLVLVTSVS